LFTAEDRGRIRSRLEEMGRSDSRLVSGALIGATASGGDQWSDIDLTFGLAQSVKLGEVLDDWTARLEREFDAVPLFDLPHMSTVYRVFLFPGNLQVDLSFTPGAEFGALGPRFKLLWGSTIKRDQTPPPSPQHLFGLGVHHLVRARICIERGRAWQAEYWISAARDQALTLACIHRGLNPSYGRGFDDLPGNILEEFKGSLVSSTNRETLLSALRQTINLLLTNSEDVRESATKLERRLHELESPLAA
jgi:hypothetical protein